METKQLLSKEAPEVLVIAQSIKHIADDMEGTITMPASYMYIMSSMLIAYAERYEEFMPDPRVDISKMADLLSESEMTKQ